MVVFGMSAPAHRENYSPILWEWALPLVCILAGGIVLGNALPFARGAAAMYILSGGTVGCWALAWLLRKQPWLCEAAGLAAAACWILFLLGINRHFCHLGDHFIFPAIFLGLAWAPWALRQRVLLGVVMLLSMVLPMALHRVGADALVLPLCTAITYGWWMLAERLRMSEGRYKGYGWVGVPACFTILLGAMHLILGTAWNAQESLLMTASAGILMLLLRPRVAWRRWLPVVAAAALPALAAGWLSEGSPSPGMGRWLAAALFPVALLWLAVAERRREWVPCCTFTLFLWFTYSPLLANLGKEPCRLAIWAAFFFLVTLCIRLYRQIFSLSQLLPK